MRREPVPVETGAELDEVLQRLPPVEKGHKRVFRGQAQVFDRVLASAYRPNRPPYVRGQLLKTIAQLLLDESRGSGSDGRYDYAIWTELVAQQYSNGSPFIDVTARTDVAIWFALTDFEPHDYVVVFGDAGPLDPDADFGARLPLLTPSPTDRELGFLLVLDLPTHPDGIPRNHGDLVDLSALPPGFLETQRIRNQSASIVYTVPESGGGDLSAFLACPPIPLARKLISNIDPEVRPSFLFPTPEEDPWYRRLLQIPLWIHLHDDNHLELGQSFEVPLYAWDPPSIEAVTEPVIVVRPPLLTPTLKNDAGRADHEAAPVLDQDSISVVVEEPIFLTSPRIDDDSWNQEALWRGLPLTARMRDETGGNYREVALTKVYFEFSPLELGDWQAAEAEGRIFHAGAYFARTGTDLSFRLVQRQFPNGPPTVSQSLTFRFDERVKRFSFVDSHGNSYEATKLGNAFKTFLVCLRLLIRLNASPVSDGITWLINGRPLSPEVSSFYLQRAVFQNDHVYLLRRDDGSGHFLPAVRGWEDLTERDQ